MAFKSIGTQITTIFSTLILLCMLAFVGLASWSAYKEALTNETHNMLQSAEQITRAAEDFVGANLEVVRGLSQQKTIASSVSLGTPSLVVKDQLAQILKGSRSLDMVAAILPDGKILAGTGIGGKDLAGTPFPHAAALAALAQGKEFIDRRPLLDKASGHVQMVLAAPVLTLTGSPAGGIAVVVNLNVFNDRFVHAIRYGKDGYPFILDEKGTLLAHPRADLLGKDMSSYDFIRTALSAPSTLVEYPWEGRDKIFTSATLELTGWKICASAYKDDLAAIARTQLILLACVGFVAVCVMAGSITLLSRKLLVRPVLAINTFASNVRDGNLDAALEGHFHHEFSQLADAMRGMVGELKNRLGFAQGVLNGMVMPVLVVDTQERAVFINQPCLDMLEIDGPPDAQLGRTLAEIFYNDPTRKTAVGRSMNERTSIKNLDVTITGHKGGKVDVLANVTYLTDLDGKIIGGFCLYLDMTERKRQAALIAEQNCRIADAANNADGVAERLASAAAELDNQIEQASRGASLQQERTASTATAMEQMNATVIDVARNAAGASQQAEQAKVRAQEGGQAVAQSINTIQHALDLASGLRADMDTLGHKAESIGAVLDVIADIADQTNLLALNAAIEAARAGDAGRGFAVVADEVRKLAEKTMNATREVDAAIKGIQESARNSIGNTQKATDAIEQGTSMVRKSGDVLTEIVRLVESTADQVRNIATAAEEQSASSEEVTSATEEVSRIASETSDVMHQAERALAEVSRLSAELATIIESMRVNADCEITA